MYESQIREVLAHMGCLDSARQLGETDSLFDAGVIDSLRMMELVAQLQQRFGISVDQNDLTPENFDSIAAISRYVRARRNPGPAGS
jgi:acyl carrier protein